MKESYISEYGSTSWFLLEIQIIPPTMISLQKLQCPTQMQSQKCMIIVISCFLCSNQMKLSSFAIEKNV